MKTRNLTVYLRWGAALLLPAALILLFELLKGSQARMGWWVDHVMAPVEQYLGRIWSVFPMLSVAEVLTALVLILGVVWLVRAVVLLIRKREGALFARRLLAMLGVVLWIWAGVCWMWNAAYYAPSFTQRSGLDVQPYSVETLEEVTALFARKAAEYSTQVQRDQDGLFAEDRESIFSQGVSVYDNLKEEFPFLKVEISGSEGDISTPRAKPLFFSRLQSILGFTGVYFPFTGEANVNVDAPSCLLPATIAHEMAHQRMVAAEQEANFVGIAASVTSGDPVFQYSGYLMGLIQLCNALAPVDGAAWNEIVQTYFTQELANDWNHNNAYWAALSSPVEDAAEQAYDSFLKGNDQELGMRSYGACVDLLVAYFGAQAAG